MADYIPTITIWQPWASLIAEECKLFEFRSWPAPRRFHGRRIGIHAGARPVKVKEVRALLVKLHSDRWRETGLAQRDRSIALLDSVKSEPRGLPLSSILCTARLEAPVRGAELAVRLGLDAVNDSDRFEHSNWGWPLREIERLEPYVPASGAQGFWTWARR